MAESRILPTLEAKMKKISDLGAETLLRSDISQRDIDYVHGLQQRGIFFGTEYMRNRVDAIGGKAFDAWDEYCLGVPQQPRIHHR
jgi:hypothetical protein